MTSSAGSSSPVLDFGGVISLFREESRALALYVLGSAATGRMRADSDVDLAFVCEPGQHLSGIEILDLATESSLRIGRTVDLGAVDSHNLVYAYQVFSTGRLLFARDVTRAEMLRSTLLGMYAAFNVERREVLDAYRA
ncbi:MAG: nucleotidyltransferase domain-containing protein [Treponema sp.]|nr:nucleotidyltransferase domain-containing protein [Treponema sp.]